MKQGLICVLALALAGCATRPLVPDASVDPRGIWTVVAVNGSATGRGEHFRFSITPPNGSAQFGCNAGSGSLSAGNGWVVAGDWIVTAASCRNKRVARLERTGFGITAQPMAVERTSTGIRLRNRIGSIDLAR